MKFLILEDEAPAYDKIIECLHDYYDNDVISYERAGSIIEGRKLLSKNNYDCILSDVKLLDGISFDLFNEIKTNIPIIFCSAHDEFLFRAFDTNGIAYILKPYSQEDFNKAITKFQNLCAKGAYNILNTGTISVLKSALNNEEFSYKKRFVVKKYDGIKLLNTENIPLIKASSDSSIIVDSEGNEYNIPNTLSVNYEQLNPKMFFKINRSEIVNINFIENLKSHTKNRLFVSLVGLKNTFLTSTATTAAFRKWIEG